jgi:hypothetical protein
MKLILFKTSQEQPAINSLKIAQQFYPGSLDLITDYDVNIKFEAIPGKPDSTIEQFTTEDLIAYINTLDEPIFVATSNTVFTAECLTTIHSAYEHFSGRLSSVLVQPTFDNDMLAHVSPTLMMYGDRRIYMTSNRITNNPLIAYGDSKIIAEIINRLGSVSENNKPLLSDGIFHGGETIVLSPMPPLAWSLDKELPVLVSSAEWDANTYIQSIPTFTREEQ